MQKLTALAKTLKGGDKLERIRGSIDIPLAPEGKEQAKHLAQVVKQGGGLDEVHSSNLQRAKDTGDEVAKASGVPNQPTPELQPWHLGDMEGKPVDPKLVSKMNDFVAHPDKVPVEGDEQSTAPPESFNTFKDRVLTHLHKQIRRAVVHKKKIGVVGHFRTFRLWESHVKAGGKGREIDHVNMVKKPRPSEETGHIAKISDEVGKPVFEPHVAGTKLTKGVYLMRHGKTSWNK
jgi:broad specificity phosphatase PhoE